jgi:hypothetical protein
LLVEGRVVVVSLLVDLRVGQVRAGDELLVHRATAALIGRGSRGRAARGEDGRERDGDRRQQSSYGRLKWTGPCGVGCEACWSFGNLPTATYKQRSAGLEVD